MSFEFFDSRSEAFKTPFGAVPTGEPVTFRLRLPQDGSYQSPRLLLFAADEWDDPISYEMSFSRCARGYNEFSYTFTPEEPALLFYCFEAARNGAVRRLSRNPDGTGSFVDSGARFWQLTVYRAEFETPDFLKGGVLYQIFPDRFARSGQPKEGVPGDRAIHAGWYEMPEYRPNGQGKITNSDYFGGDLRGIQEKLPYLESLGVTCLYLNPIFEAHSNHRYNTADYLRVDPLLGTEEDLRALCAAARERGIRVILDGVFSHTGDDSRYFNRKGRYPTLGAYQSQESPYYGWYEFRRWPDDYACWWDFETLPNVDESNPDYIRFICGEGGVVDHWMSLGVSGFRLDVADELPDGFLDALHDRVKAHDSQGLVLGEVWEDASNKVAYGRRRRYLLGDQLDSVMDYPLRDAILAFLRGGRGDALYHAVLTLLENYPKPALHTLMNSLSTHDVERAITALVCEPLGRHSRDWQMAHHFLDDAAYRYGSGLFRLASVLQFFLPGVPCLYYGDEVGMTGYRDPFNRCTYPWDRGDASLLEFVRSLSALRGEHRALLADADFLPVLYGENLFAFARVKEGHGLLIAVNRGESPLPLGLPYPVEPLLGGLENGTLAPLSFVVGRF